MAQTFILTCAVFGTLGVATASNSGLRQAKLTDTNAAAAEGGDKAHQQHSLLVHVPEAVDQHLVICNAYASDHPLDVMTVRTRQTITENGPLAYKQCKDFTVGLEEGDQLDFKAGNLDVGTFYATGLPKSSASLLLIPHRRSPHAVGVSFESHAFADVRNPQIAVIDAFRSKSGKKDGKVSIIETVPASSSNKDTTRIEEDLKFNSVVAVNPGEYEIALLGSGGHVNKVPLKASGAEKYVIMRLGVEEEGGKSKYPQELVVFPNSASRFTPFGFALIVAMTALLRL